MRVVIDADGCPVVKIVEKICKEKNLPLILICDTCHVFNSDIAEVITVDKGADSADFKLVNILKKDDVVITQDYGLAAMCLSKKAKVISQNGMVYNSDNIDSLLLARYTAKKIRNAGGRLKGNSKRTKAQDDEFIRQFLKIL